MGVRTSRARPKTRPRHVPMWLPRHQVTRTCATVRLDITPKEVLVSTSMVAPTIHATVPATLRPNVPIYLLRQPDSNAGVQLDTRKSEASVWTSTVVKVPRVSRPEMIRPLAWISKHLVAAIHATAQQGMHHFQWVMAGRKGWEGRARTLTRALTIRNVRRVVTRVQNVLI